MRSRRILGGLTATALLLPALACTRPADQAPVEPLLVAGVGALESLGDFAVDVVDDQSQHDQRQSH